MSRISWNERRRTPCVRRYAVRKPASLAAGIRREEIAMKLAHNRSLPFRLATLASVAFLAAGYAVLGTAGNANWARGPVSARQARRGAARADQCRRPFTSARIVCDSQMDDLYTGRTQHAHAGRSHGGSCRLTDCARPVTSRRCRSSAGSRQCSQSPRCRRPRRCGQRRPRRR